MNLGEFRTAIERRSNVARDAAALTGWVNDALAEIAALQPFWWLRAVDEFTTTDQDNTYSLPARYRDTVGVTINGYRARALPVIDGLASDSSWRLHRARYGYSVDGANLRLWPMPGVWDVEHHYVTYEATLSGDSDTPLLPVHLHPAVVCLATMKVVETVPGRARQLDRLEKEWRGHLTSLRWAAVTSPTEAGRKL